MKTDKDIEFSGEPIKRSSGSSRRKSRRLYRFAVDLFITLLSQITGRQSVNYRCNDADEAAWNTFWAEFGDTIGEDFIRKFCEYGMQSWFNDGTERDYSRAVRFSWVFGGNAIKRWRAFDVQTNVRITRGHLKQNHKINTIERKTELGEIVTSVRMSEEQMKAEFFGTMRGLLWCRANTTLYHHKSAHCVTCPFKSECKEALRENYPRVYERRGYGGGGC